MWVGGTVGNKEFFLWYIDLAHWFPGPMFFLLLLPVPSPWFSSSPRFWRFALFICSWNQLTLNLFPGISTSPGDLPIDWPFNPVVKILPILTDMKQFQFGCFKVLAGVIRDVKFTYLLCGAQTLPGNWFSSVTVASGGLTGTVAKSTLSLSSVHTPHSENTLYDLSRSPHMWINY